jgi:hypothetical protein
MRVASVAALLIACFSCAHAPQFSPGAAVAGEPVLRVIEFGDHPDPNTGTPKVLQNAAPWPADVPALLAAVQEVTGRRNSVYDMRHGALAPDAAEQLEETNVRVLQMSGDGARVIVRMDSSPTAVEAFVPLRGTAVVGSDSVDEHHAYVAVSLLGDLTNEVFSPREPDVTAPVKISGALPAATPTAIQYRQRGVVVETEIDANGNVVAARAITTRYLSDADRRAVEETIKTWKFRPATRNDAPVAVLTNLTVDYAR